MDKLRELVMTAMGKASMYWEPIPKGVFQSTHAKEIGEKLLADIKQQALNGSEKQSPKCLCCGSENITIECGDCKEKRSFGTWSA